jgi:hypothetical protein
MRIACGSSDAVTANLRETCVAEMIRWQLDEATHGERWLGRSDRDFEDNMEMFGRAGFFKAAELLAKKWGRLDRVVDCLVLDHSRRYEALQGISSVLIEAGKAGSQQRSSVVSKIVAHGSTLASIDPAGTALIVDSCSPESHLKIVVKLEDSKIQFQYLNSVLDAPGYGQRMGGPSSSELYESYIDLMCRLDPGSVLQYLQDLAGTFIERPYSLAKVG